MHHYISNNFSKHAWLIPSLTEDMQVTHTEHISYVDSGLSCDTFNIIYIHHSNLVLDELKGVVEQYEKNQREYCIWIGEENLSPQVENILSSLNIKRQAHEAGMILLLEEYTPIADTKHTNISEVKNLDQLKEYAKVIAENWSPPDQNVMDYYDRTSRHYLDKSNNIQLLIYAHEGAPASTVEMFPTDEETVGLYGFATLSKYRGQGIGTSLLTFCLNKAKELGYKRVILQGTDDGLGIYRRFGFREVTNYYEYA